MYSYVCMHIHVFHMKPCLCGKGYVRIFHIPFYLLKKTLVSTLGLDFLTSNESFSEVHKTLF